MSQTFKFITVISLVDCVTVQVLEYVPVYDSHADSISESIRFIANNFLAISLIVATLSLDNVHISHGGIVIPDSMVATTLQLSYHFV